MHAWEDSCNDLPDQIINLQIKERKKNGNNNYNNSIS